jgi:hypothetical protein
MNKSDIIVYISGPLTTAGSLDENIKAAKKVAERYWELGYTVICPHLNCSFDIDVSYDKWMEYDIRLLSKCNIVVLMNGWEHSNGSVIEFKEAVKLGLDIVFDRNDTLRLDIITQRLLDENL